MAKVLNTGRLMWRPKVGGNLMPPRKSAPTPQVARVGAAGSVVRVYLPQQISSYLGVEPGDRLIFRTEGGRVWVEKLV